MSHNQHFGRRGEEAAARWYDRAGYHILDRNWRCPEGELDLVVALGPDVVFVEVKARSSSRFGTGAEAVDRRKQRRVRALAGRWLAGSGRRFRDVRFDVVEVDRESIVAVHEGCF